MGPEVQRSSQLLGATLPAAEGEARNYYFKSLDLPVAGSHEGLHRNSCPNIASNLSDGDGSPHRECRLE